MRNFSRSALPTYSLLFIAVQSTLLASPLCAQVADPSAQRVDPIVVTGNPFGSPAVRADGVLSGDALAQRAAATLGETLSHLPGLSSSYFGPGASRPIIRGFDGERVRMMENGAASVDAASLSPDHAVPIDPAHVSRIEVLRGPAALLYGSNAIGGVVNAISNRIPRTPSAGWGGDAQLLGGTGDQTRAMSARVEAGGAGLAFHGDVSRRSSSDVQVPTHLYQGESRAKIINSATESQSGALGVSRVWKGGFVGLSVDRYASEYGVVATDDVSIDLRRTRTMAAFSQDNAFAPFANLRGHAAWTRYAHDEIEGGGDIGSRFANRGLEWRIEATTKPIGAWRLIAGLSGESSKFTAVGEEAFVPPNRSQSVALFGLAQHIAGSLETNVGFRTERSRVRTEAVTDDDGELRFGAPDTRRSSPMSAAANASLSLSKEVITRVGLSYTQRAPTYFERYADGVHVATNAYEVGDRNLRNERALQSELALAWTRDGASVKGNMFYARFKDYIALEATGSMREADHHHDAQEGGPDGEALVPEVAFRAVPARFVGGELEAKWRINAASQTLDLSAHLDVVRATNRDTGEPLPRIAPMRFGAGIVWERGPVRFSTNLLHAFAQNRIPQSQDETATARYTLVSAAIGYRVPVASREMVLTLRGANLGNALAYNAASVQSVRLRAPLPGRSVSVSLQMNF